MDLVESGVGELAMMELMFMHTQTYFPPVFLGMTLIAVLQC